MADTARRFTIRWDVSMWCYRVSEPNIQGPTEVVVAEDFDRLASALAKADAEVTALADALRAAGVRPHAVQAIIDDARPRQAA